MITLFALDERVETKIATLFHERQNCAGATSLGLESWAPPFSSFMTWFVRGINYAFQECTLLLEMVTVA
jgi:hypothetical protein